MLHLVHVRDEKGFKPPPQNRILVPLDFFKNSRRTSPSLSFAVPRVIHLFHDRAQLEGNFLRCARACARLPAQMTQKSCAIRMRNAILRNHLQDLQYK